MRAVSVCRKTFLHVILEPHMFAILSLTYKKFYHLISFCLYFSDLLLVRYGSMCAVIGNDHIRHAFEPMC